MQSSLDDIRPFFFGSEGELLLVDKNVLLWKQICELHEETWHAWNCFVANIALTRTFLWVMKLFGESGKDDVIWPSFVIECLI